MIATELETLLDAQWNTDVIAKPSFKTGEFDPQKIHPKECRIRDRDHIIQSASSDFELDFNREIFSITINDTPTNVVKYAAEVKRILHQATIDNGWYRIVSAKVTNHRQMATLELEGVKRIFTEVTAW